MGVALGVKPVEAAFDHLDLHCVGTITWESFSNYLSAMKLDISHTETFRFFSRFDAKRNGTLRLRDLRLALTRARALSQNAACGENTEMTAENFSVLALRFLRWLDAKSVLTVKDVMQEFILDGVESITCREVEQAMAWVPNLSQSECARFAASLDADRDGVIRFQDLEAAFRQAAALRAQQADLESILRQEASLRAQQ